VRALAPLLLLASALTGCAYRTGSFAPTELAGVKTIAVPIVKSELYEPAQNTMITDAIIQRFHNDGTFAVRRTSEADAIVRVHLEKLERDALRSVRADTRVAAEYRITVTARVEVERGGRVVLQATERGETEFFVGNDLQEAERQAFGLLAEDLAGQVVTRVTEGW
jgi:GTP cyclohydrolase II